MLAILRKEINSFFASPIGYLVIAIFLVVNGLFLWVFKGDYNILDYGFTDLSSFFFLAPWILLFLIPAVTMRSFSEEKKQGTLELLLTKPISRYRIVLGKFWGALLLVLIALLPTLLYSIAINTLAEGNSLDAGSTLGAYIGLLFLAASYTAIGVFASALTSNQIVAFLLAVALCLLFYIGFQGIADTTGFFFFEFLSLGSHYSSMGLGVLDTRDIIYFVGLTGLFLWCTSLLISLRKIPLKNWLILPAIWIVFIFVGQNIYGRVDMTQDERYSLNQATKAILKDSEQLLKIDVFLQGEGFTSEFKRLQRETRQLLEEFEAVSPNVDYIFINPLENDATRTENIRMLTERGLTPMQVSVQQSGKTSQDIVFPWALASYGDITVKIPLIKNNIGASQQDLVTHSVAHLEYAFADALSKLMYPKRRKIAVLRGNGQLPNANVADFVTALRDYYFIAPFTLDSVSANPKKVINDLQEYDLIINAKPTQAFTEQEKYVLDQYTMNGGKSLWLLDAVAIDTDSLYNQSGTAYATVLDLNLTDFLFKYGVRINANLINDLYAAPITLATGADSQSQFNQFPWFYSPLVSTTAQQHPISKNVNSVKFNFASQIDTLTNTVQKTILLQSSELTRIDGLPKIITLEDVLKEPIPEQYTAGPQPLAVLLEGNFTSVYNNRIKPVKTDADKTQSEATKIIVVADGDLAKNEVSRNGPVELGFDRFSGTLYGNKEFLLNSVNYLLDDTGLVNLRSKEVALGFLDQQKVAEQRTKWQLITIIVPLLFLGLFGLFLAYRRKKKFAFQ